MGLDAVSRGTSIALRGVDRFAGAGVIPGYVPSRSAGPRAL